MGKPADLQRVDDTSSSSSSEGLQFTMLPEARIPTFIPYQADANQGDSEEEEMTPGIDYSGFIPQESMSKRRIVGMTSRPLPFIRVANTGNRGTKAGVLPMGNRCDTGTNSRELTTQQDRRGLGPERDAGDSNQKAQVENRSTAHRYTEKKDARQVCPLKSPTGYLVSRGLYRRDVEAVIDASGVYTVDDFTFFEDEKMMAQLVEEAGLKPIPAKKLLKAIKALSQNRNKIGAIGSSSYRSLSGKAESVGETTKQRSSTKKASKTGALQELNRIKDVSEVQGEGRNAHHGKKGHKTKVRLPHHQGDESAIFGCSILWIVVHFLLLSALAYFMSQEDDDEEGFFGISFSNYEYDFEYPMVGMLCSTGGNNSMFNLG
jgi:hypothetical protein